MLLAAKINIKPKTAHPNKIKKVIRLPRLSTIDPIITKPIKEPK